MAGAPAFYLTTVLEQKGKTFGHGLSESHTWRKIYSMAKSNDHALKCHQETSILITVRQSSDIFFGGSLRSKYEISENLLHKSHFNCFSWQEFRRQKRNFLIETKQQKTRSQTAESDSNSFGWFLSFTPTSGENDSKIYFKLWPSLKS